MTGIFALFEKLIGFFPSVQEQFRPSKNNSVIHYYIRHSGAIIITFLIWSDWSVWYIQSYFKWLSPGSLVSARLKINIPDMNTYLKYLVSNSISFWEYLSEKISFWRISPRTRKYINCISVWGYPSWHMAPDTIQLLVSSFRDISIICILPSTTSWLLLSALHHKVINYRKTFSFVASFLIRTRYALDIVSDRIW